MAHKKYDLAVKVSEYTDGQGQTKGRWQNVGAVMDDGNGGQFIMLNKWFNPAGVQDLSGRGGESILVSMFEPKQNGNQQQAPAPAPQQHAAPQQQSAPAQPAPQQQGQPAGQPGGVDDLDPDVPF